MIETGTLVKWTDRGFGFIAPDNGGSDVFAHIRQLDGTDPEKGMRVEYEAAPAQPRPKATCWRELVR